MSVHHSGYMPESPQPVDRRRPDAPKVEDRTPSALAARIPTTPLRASFIEWCAWFLAFLIPELIAVFGNHPLSTLSYSLRYAEGDQYGWRWVVLQGALTGLCVWLIIHIGFYLGPKWLLLFTVCSWLFYACLVVFLRYGVDGFVKMGLH